MRSRLFADTPSPGYFSDRTRPHDFQISLPKDPSSFVLEYRKECSAGQFFLLWKYNFPLLSFLSSALRREIARARDTTKVQRTRSQLSPSVSKARRTRGCFCLSFSLFFFFFFFVLEGQRARLIIICWEYYCYIAKEVCVCVGGYFVLSFFFFFQTHVRTLSLPLLKNLSLLFYIITSLSLSLSRYFYTLLHQVTALVLLPRLLVKHLTR